MTKGWNWRRSQQTVAEPSEKWKQEQGKEEEAVWSGMVRVPTMAVGRWRAARTRRSLGRRGEGGGGRGEEEVEGKWGDAVAVRGREEWSRSASFATFAPSIIAMADRSEFPASR